MPSAIASDNHVLQLMSLEQHRETLLLAGFPTRREASFAVRRALNEAAAGALPVVLIAPAQRVLALESGLQDGDPPDPDEERVLLPPIRCLGHFRSSPLDPRSGARHSELSILWWQDVWASPIDPDVHKAIAAVDWQRYARDCTD